MSLSRPSNFTFELSENDQLDEQLCEQIKCFKSLGVRISIDDFGIGYSDINKVINLNVDEVKFDKSIVNSHEPASSDLVKRTLAYCKESGIETVAEGVGSTQIHAD